MEDAAFALIDGVKDNDPRLRLFLETLECGPYDRFVRPVLFEPCATPRGPGDNIPSICSGKKKKVLCHFLIVHHPRSLPK